MRLLPRLFLIFVLASCAKPVDTRNDTLADSKPNSSARAYFKRAIPKRLKVSCPPPISHSEPESVTTPRLRQIESVVITELAKKGYDVIPSHSLEGGFGLDETRVSID